jgi:hypothetical protein
LQGIGTTTSEQDVAVLRADVMVCARSAAEDLTWLGTTGECR